MLHDLTVEVDLQLHPISREHSIPIFPGNARKSQGQYFQGVKKRNIGPKWVNLLTVLHELDFSAFLRKPSKTLNFIFVFLAFLFVLFVGLHSFL